MKLSGFSIGTVRRMDADLPPELVPGCAAIEQYVTGYSVGEPTDVYGFGASLFFTLTGTMPQEALKRRTDSRLLIPTSILRSLPPHVVTAMANSLQVTPDRRTQTFERLRAELSAAPTVTATIEEAQRLVPPELRSAPPAREKEEKPEKKDVPPFVWVILSCVLALILFIVVGIVWMSLTNQQAPGTAQQSSAVGSALDSQAAALIQSSEDSSDLNMMEAPNLIGMNYQDMKKRMSSASSASQEYQVLLSTKQFSDTVPEGCIISQSPTPGSKMAKGSDIVVVVSEGAAVRTLPPIAGKTLAEASVAVSSAGFTPSKTEAYSATVAKDTVIDYDTVKAGSQMAYGSQVIIVISKGPDPSAVSSQASQPAG